MNLSGYVPLRRGILHHTMDGSLTLQEFAAFTTLVMLADKATGAGKINGPVLRTFLPGLTVDAAKRVLQSLEEKRYIFRKITPRSPILYPFWVNRYRPTVGPYRLLQLSLEEVFETKDASRLRYVAPAPDSSLGSSPDTSLETSLGSSPDTPHYNKKDKGEGKADKKTPPPIDQSECITKQSNDAHIMSTVMRNAERHIGAGDAHRVSNQCARDYSATPRLTPPQLPFGMVWRDGQVFTTEGTLISANALAVLLDVPGETT